MCSASAAFQQPSPPRGSGVRRAGAGRESRASGSTSIPARNSPEDGDVMVADTFVVGGLQLPSSPDDSYAVLVEQLTRRLRQSRPTRLYAIGRSTALDAIQVPPARVMSSLLLGDLWRLRPRLIFYIYPTTLAALARARLMNILGRGARVIMVTPQPVKWRWWTAALARLLWPSLVLVPSRAELREARRIGPAETYLTGVDTMRFRPALPGEREALRHRWQLPQQARIVLHVGHLVPSRNLAVLGELARLPQVQPVLLVSRFRVAESVQLEDQLRRSGVLILSGYRSNVEELYRTADCYLFPVKSPDGALAMPLSVLEALASDVPVAPPRCGALPDLFEGAPGIRFSDTDDGLVRAVEDLLARRATTRHLVEPFSWDVAIGRLLERSGCFEPALSAAAAPNGT